MTHVAKSKRIGGRRVLAISPKVLIDFCKRHDGMHRTYTVERALPDDARIVAIRIVERGDLIEVVLESAEWDSDLSIPLKELPTVEITVYYMPAAK